MEEFDKEEEGLEKLDEELLEVEEENKQDGE